MLSKPQGTLGNTHCQAKPAGGLQGLTEIIEDARLLILDVLVGNCLAREDLRPVNEKPRVSPYTSELARWPDAQPTATFPVKADGSQLMAQSRQG